MSDEPILDPQAVENLRAISPDDGGEFLRELIAIFLSDTPARMAELDQALGQGDYTTATRAAHSVKGSASNFGANQLAAVAKELESQCKAGTCTVSSPLLPSLKGEYARVETALKAL